ncbi:DUF3267 domain-containing protein [Spirosoma soli]|uniref:DUF3267 domain-containing protein n=1 Tax=Spirosoma soli TaxID=1770529 RepID=A0ABW5M1Q5_9BACT
MRPTVDELHHSDRYVLIESFSIDEMNQFIFRELGMTPPSADNPPRRTWKTWLGLLIILLLGGGVGYFVGSLLGGQVKHGNGMSLVWQLVGGLVGLLILLPIHELIHGLAFKYIGAPHIGYGYSLRSLIVYAYSQLFPTTMREVAFVAVMPFIIITTSLLIGWAIWPVYKVFWLILLIIHTSACIGDFALIRYYYKNRQRTIYTYDDVEGERRSYFFEKV